MFRKRKNVTMQLDLPPPPTMEQLVKDLEKMSWKTGESSPLDLSPNLDETKASSPKSKDSLSNWWKEFEHVLSVQKQLEQVKKEIGEATSNLNEKQTRINEEATKLKDDIQALQKTIETALNEYNEFTNKMKMKKR